jgi:hypothetical protein
MLKDGKRAGPSEETLHCFTQQATSYSARVMVFTVVKLQNLHDRKYRRTLEQTYVRVGCEIVIARKLT